VGKEGGKVERQGGQGVQQSEYNPKGVKLGKGKGGCHKKHYSSKYRNGQAETTGNNQHMLGRSKGTAVMPEV
jgi:hypothetical protein